MWTKIGDVLAVAAVGAGAVGVLVLSAIAIANADPDDVARWFAQNERDAAEEAFRRAANGGKIGDMIVEGLRYARAEEALKACA